MQNISLGDYKGGRDTLQTAMGMKYEPLDSIMATSAALAKEGMSGISSRELYKQHDAATLHAAMIAHQNSLDIEDYKDSLLGQREEQKRYQTNSDESEVLSGEEEAALEHAKHVFSLMSPEDQAANLPWLQQMHATMGKGSVAKRKGRMAYSITNNLNDPLALAALTAARAKRFPNQDGKSSNGKNKYND